MLICSAQTDFEPHVRTSTDFLPRHISIMARTGRRTEQALGFPLHFIGLLNEHRLFEHRF